MSVVTGLVSCAAAARPEVAGLRNAMTVDVEDYFQVEAFADRISRTSWDGIPRRVEANVDRLLELFAAAGVKATFFVLGWLAERHKEMVRRIAAADHEVASHGYDHRRADRLDPPGFREDVRRAKRILEEIAARPVSGYRAP
ncbi:MAG TPA: polysaccharide deacetylase family protein, partial [Stellaceae bacterium]|nr:polysaccharide deacetylase family protein [Stellaceae bacterium]